VGFPAATSFRNGKPPWVSLESLGIADQRLAALLLNYESAWLRWAGALMSSHLDAWTGLLRQTKDRRMMSSHVIFDRIEAAGTWKMYCPTPHEAPCGRQVVSVSARHFGSPARSGLAERRALAITRHARDGHGSCRTAKDVVHSRRTNLVSLGIRDEQHEP
jgi:hypothetical protein